ncbi:hypothetical protein J421_1628 [Gemmatirosa kalamazoonensis]|uniref:Uncharacterized protein n=1 Tax=Gemmatirosa kalamazoonensis TaxID=861299 RepID=W0RFP4_9BACT|nr:hypothetical protein [Gemmatirosa kalamazoonensis]AHG89165.1 hypothetical protein J421_1628 [Gemmatirosa kalamazoonensis]
MTTQPGRYRQLDASEIDATLRRLRDRVAERFPDSELGEVSAELVALAEEVGVAREDTAASPVRTMTPPELGRYLDYCSELLSLTSKLAALFVQHFTDPVVLGAVNEIETLVTGLSGKIWQKIEMLERVVAREAGRPAGAEA